MVSLLLQHKVKLQQQAGMCHPGPHVPQYSSHSKFFFVSPSSACGGVSKDAYQRVIDKDDVMLLELLLNIKSSPRLLVVWPDSDVVWEFYHNMLDPDLSLVTAEDDLPKS